MCTYNLKKSLLAFIVVSVLGVSFVVPFPVHAQAENMDREQIISLIMQLLATLQTQSTTASPTFGTSPEGGFTSSGFSVGDEVKTSAILRVRSGPGVNNSLVNNIAAYTTGSIVSGPRYADGYTWWLVQYNNGTRGWSAEGWFTKLSKNNVTPLVLEDVSVTVADPDSGDVYEYGDRLTVTWNQQGSVPRNSEACVTLYNVRTKNSFAFPPSGAGCVDIAGEEPQSGVSAEVIRNSGYDLGPGNYRAVVTLRGPGVGYKDGAIIAEAKSGTFYIEDVLKEEKDYDIDITSPRRGAAYEIGDRITVKWDHNDLEDDVLNVTLLGPLDGYKAERHMVQSYLIDKGSASFTIPEADSLGRVREGRYELSVWVTNIKDGSAKSVSDDVVIEINDKKDVSAVDIEFIDNDTRIKTSSPALGEWGNFTVEFEIIAGDEDVWIKNSLYGTHQNNSSSLYQPKYSVMKDGEVVSNFTGNFSSMQPGFLSTASYAYPIADEKNDNYYVVKAGDSEKFTVDITMTVKESADYQVHIEGPLYVKTKSGDTVVLNIDEDEFRTAELYIEGEDSL